MPQHCSSSEFACANPRRSADGELTTLAKNLPAGSPRLGLQSIYPDVLRTTNASMSLSSCGINGALS
jgi:hypothetical protein